MIVIKIGGGKNINIDNITKDLAALKEQVVIVHGGNFYLDEFAKKLGIEKKMLTSPAGLQSRYTTPEVIELIYLTYAGLANKKIVAGLQKGGINAFGLSGLDGKLITGKKHESLLVIENGKKRIIKNDLTGSVKEINTKLLKHLLNLGLIPVISPPVITDDGLVINVDGDKITSKIAQALQTEILIFLIEAPGILINIKDEKSLVKKTSSQGLEELILQVEGRMKRKLMEIKKLIDCGVKKIIVADGRIKNPITNALNGGGTHVA